MKIDEIVEGFVRVMGRRGGKLVHRYRCTAGGKKGKIFADPATCSSPKSIKKARDFKIAKSKRPSSIKFKTARTKRMNPASRQLQRINTGLRSQRTPSRNAGRLSGSRRSKI
jgi:hypothetical protein